MTHTTPVAILVSGHLRTFSGSAPRLDLAAATVREVLAVLEREHAPLHRAVCEETGVVRRHIGVFVNASHIRDLDGLDTVLAPGDVVTFLPAVSGG